MGDHAAIAEDKKKKKKKKGGKKGKGKSEEGEEGGKKKKEKKVKRKKKSKAPVEKTDGGVSSDEDIQPQMPLPRQKTELWVLGPDRSWISSKLKQAPVTGHPKWDHVLLHVAFKVSVSISPVWNKWHFVS